MSQLSSHAAGYLELRRALGFTLAKEGRLLPDFAAFAEAAGAGTVTVDLAVRWAAKPDGTSPVRAAQRLSMVRGFARYLQTADPAAQVPPAGLLPARAYRRRIEKRIRPGNTPLPSLGAWRTASQHEPPPTSADRTCPARVVDACCSASCWSCFSPIRLASL